MSVESRDYPDVHDVEDKSRWRRQKEFDDLLDLAERLQEKCDRDGQRVSFYRTFQAALVLYGVIGIALFATTMSFSPTRMSFIAFGVLYAAGSEYLIVRKVLVRRNHDRRALSEVVELLRSTERSVAKDVGFSALERARLRIQLSRFDI